jgi:aspartokinase-like uncharacterized kinase
MHIIKLGGSLEKSKHLIKCFNVIDTLCVEKVVIVSGGGHFADQVRLSQQSWQFKDAIAHEMAILAMQQMALLFQGIRPDFQCLNSIAEIKNSTFPVIIWLPDLTELNTMTIPKNWTVTSDSLAAWLATQLQANKLTLIKSVACDSFYSIEQFLEAGIIDESFPSFVKDSPFLTQIISVETFCYAVS